MKNAMKRNLFFFLFFLSLLGCKSNEVAVIPVNLRTEYLHEPIGIDAKSPNFSWEYEGNCPDFVPSKNEVLIGTNPKQLTPYSSEMVLKPRTKYYWNVTAWDVKGKRSETSKTATFETGMYSLSDWSGKWITDNHDKDFRPAPLLRKAFDANKKIQKARLYVTAAGYYEMDINGKRVGTNYMDPGYTHFDKRLLYVTHDVSSLLEQGENVIAGVLGNGWYNEQSKAVWNFETARWRGRPSLLCELHIIYTDGSKEIVTTDASWKTSTGPYVLNNIYSGDWYDANLEQSGWNNIHFDDSKWQPAIETKCPTQMLVAQQMPAIRVSEELKPIAMTAFNDHNYLFTFEKNFAGVCRLRVKGEAGTRIELRHGERIDDKGHLSIIPINEYFHPVDTTEKFQTDVYILKGNGEETFTPSFTYHGFQYVEVESSKPVQLTKESLTGLFMHTDVQPVGHFSCSNALLNKIWDASMNAYVSNLYSIPTDCPQREKNGWTADAHVSVDLGTWGFDGITLYEKWMNDFIDNQREQGNISGIIPSDTWGYDDWIGPVWDAALFIIPNAMYNYYGNLRCIQNLYPTMERYLKYLNSREKDGLMSYGIGDWVPWKATTNTNYTSSAYYYWDNVLMARFASLLGKDAMPYQQKAEEIKKLVNNKYFDATKNIYAEGTQAGQAVALYLGLVSKEKEKAVADKLHELVRTNDYFLDFGMLGSKTVPAMLAKYGYIEDAMKMITKIDKPSWGYWIEKMNYKTLPEDWGCASSLNHVFLGDVSAWMMNWLAGINYDTNNPGFRRILIIPHFVNDLNWAKGEYHSVNGYICSEWKREGTKIVLTVTIPIGTEATVKVGDKVVDLKGGTHKLEF